MVEPPPSSEGSASKLGYRACRLRASSNTESLVCLNSLGAAYVWKGKRGKRRYREWFDRERHCKNQEDRLISLAAGIDCLRRVQASTFWEWKRGSRLFFWRWGSELWKEVKDGALVWVKDELPITKLKHCCIKDKEIRSLVVENLSEFRAKGYVTAGEEESLISVFLVPKGDDIRLVYNGYSSGLNDAMWAPWFSLPTVESHLRVVDPGTFMADNDVGEMFLNFMMDFKMRPYAGVDLTTLFPEELVMDGLSLY